MLKSYVLITAARNEEAYIEKTLCSVIAQTILPKMWVIVSDGSTDRTDKIIKQYASMHSFILLLRRSADHERNFGSKAKALSLAYEHLASLTYDFVGNLDADVSFDHNYYEDILKKFDENERLGLAGGTRFDLYGGRFHKVHCARNSVGGPFQLFRRQCYEAIGGYRPLRWGGIDGVAEVMARMHGWKVESFPEIRIYHYRRTGSASDSIIRASFKVGVQNYSIGYHIIFQISRSVSRLFHSPLLIGSLSELTGYLWAALKRREREVPDDFVRYLRSEQITRLRSLLLRESPTRTVKHSGDRTRRDKPIG
jgi:glycosyltransferase involved in cell wall biosynthesis